MAKQKNRLSEGMQNIIVAPLQEYGIKVEDIQDALKDLLGGLLGV